MKLEISKSNDHLFHNDMMGFFSVLLLALDELEIYPGWGYESFFSTIDSWFSGVLVWNMDHKQEDRM